MSKKQVDISVRMFKYAPADPTATSEANSQYIRENYLSRGWEVLQTEVSQVTAGEVYIAFTFVKYEVPEVEKVVGGSDTTNKKNN